MSAVLQQLEANIPFQGDGRRAVVRQFDLLVSARKGVAQLRKCLLALAVRGKLTAHSQSEGSAANLLQQIRLERDRLVGAGETKREMSIAEVDDSEIPFPLPPGWLWVRLGELCSYIQRGKGPTYAEHSLHRVISQKCVRWHGLDLAPARYVTPESLSSYDAARFLRAGDLLWNSTGTGTIGRACVVPDCLDDARLVADSHVTVVRPLLVHSDFLLRWIQSSYVQDEIEELASGTTNQIELNTTTVVNHLVPLPPSAEQSRIVARVDELMRLCDVLETEGRFEEEQHARLLDTLLGMLPESTTPEELAADWGRVAANFDLLLDRPEAVDALEQTILRLAVRGLLVKQDANDEAVDVLLRSMANHAEERDGQKRRRRGKPLKPVDPAAAPFKLPTGWAWARFPELGEFGRGKSRHRPRNDPALFDPPIYPLVQTGEVARANGIIREYHSRYSEVGLAQSRLWPAGTLCITIAANIADSAMLGFDACFPDSVVGFVPHPELGGAAYFHAFMETARDHLVDFAPATAQKNINLEILESLLIPVPPKREMERIVARLAELRRLCADLRQRLVHTQAVQANLADALVEQAVA